MNTKVIVYTIYLHILLNCTHVYYYYYYYTNRKGLIFGYLPT